ncbi:hypothetical protein CGZ94_12190 [Enemella evansiae]|uniref:Uncharacterized protein n=1 Tax=Enemella evansiae TaxID=2016499 RepID=A0A255G9S6_9ACTN|nr:hypothetical protein [Enemella evansiae]OYO01508.1 hypothetical protein CGZ95_06925 [Enemella evansiae]OYO12668.1 hypothetical protein CGZ94_12190 [Enemella evansiae]
MIAAYDFGLHVHYGYASLTGAATDEDVDLIEARAGQRNGILGARVVGALSFVFGLHTGVVPFRVEVHASEPAVGVDWEDVVEVDYLTDEVSQFLTTFDDSVAFDLAEVGNHRARYSASGMDLAHDLTRLSGEPELDRYLLQLWPAESQPERVIRQTSDKARNWAGVAEQTPPPTDEGRHRAAAQWLEEEGRRQEHERQRRREAEQERSRLAWGGTLPTPELEAAGWNARALAKRDREFAELLVDAPAAVQRQLLRWLLEQGVRHLPQDQDWRPVIEAAINGALDASELDRIRVLLFGPPEGLQVVAVSQFVGSQDPPVRPAVWPPAAIYGALAAATQADNLSRILVDVVTNFLAMDDPAVSAAVIRSRLEELLRR